jgi:hypothetical protein
VKLFIVLIWSDRVRIINEKKRMPRWALQLQFKRKRPVEQPKIEKMIRSDAGKHEVKRREMGRN